MLCRKAAADPCETRRPRVRALFRFDRPVSEGCQHGVIAAAAAAMEREIKQVSYPRSVNITPSYPHNIGSRLRLCQSFILRCLRRFQSNVSLLQPKITNFPETQLAFWISLQSMHYVVHLHSARAVQASAHPAVCTEMWVFFCKPN